MANENALDNVIVAEEIDDELIIDFDELEKSLQDEINNEILKRELMDQEIEVMNNPEALGESVKNVIWEQFINQVASQVGEEFVKDNNGMRLDLSKDAHIQTAENFAEGKIALHNSKIDYQERYDTWQDNFQKNEDGSIKLNKDGNSVLRVYKKGSEDYNTNYDAREYIDKDRPMGSKTVHKDHTISAAEIIRDPEAAAYMDRDKQAEFANSEKNLVDLDAAANQSKSDKKMTEWLDSERDGKKPGERFNIDEEELRQRDKDAREEYKRKKEEGKKEAELTGKQSQKEEALKVGKHAVKAILFTLLAALVREVVNSFVAWIKSKDKSFKSLLLSFKNAIVSFVSKLHLYIINAIDVGLTVIAEAIFGPIVRIIKRVWILLKQGFHSLSQAVQYINNPANKGKSSEIKMMEIGKIVIAGASAAGAIGLTQLIESGLTYLGEYCPALIVEIPIIGSLASILGIFFGGLIAGIIGALIMLVIDKAIEKTKAEELNGHIIASGNSILQKQQELIGIKDNKMQMTRDEEVRKMVERHNDTEEQLDYLYTQINNNEDDPEDIDFKDIEDPLNDIWKRLSKI